jgi:hypothetical protein
MLYHVIAYIYCDRSNFDLISAGITPGMTHEEVMALLP